MINVSENESMVIEDPETDIEGAQYSLDYSQLSVINCSVIKKLISKIKKLEDIIYILLRIRANKKIIVI
jgi:hypothetical protein